MKSTKTYNLQERPVGFLALVISNTNLFKKGFTSEHLLKQLIKSVTSSALNYGEAQSAESKRNFIHKMKICLKELRESQVNLQILEKSNLIDNQIEFKPILKDVMS